MTGGQIEGEGRTRDGGDTNLFHAVAQTWLGCVTDHREVVPDGDYNCRDIPYSRIALHLYQDLGFREIVDYCT